jgi:hypothetical protein
VRITTRTVGSIAIASRWSCNDWTSSLVIAFSFDGRFSAAARRPSWLRSVRRRRFGHRDIMSARPGVVGPRSGDERSAHGHGTPVATVAAWLRSPSLPAGRAPRAAATDSLRSRSVRCATAAATRRRRSTVRADPRHAHARRAGNRARPVGTGGRPRRHPADRHHGDAHPQRRHPVESWGPGGTWLVDGPGCSACATGSPFAAATGRPRRATQRRRRSGSRVVLAVPRAPPAILAQRVTTGEAVRQWRSLCLELGEQAPGRSGLRLPPSPGAARVDAPAGGSIRSGSSASVRRR